MLMPNSSKLCENMQILLRGSKVRDRGKLLVASHNVFFGVYDTQSWWSCLWTNLSTTKCTSTTGSNTTKHHYSYSVCNFQSARLYK